LFPEPYHFIFELFFPDLFGRVLEYLVNLVVIKILLLPLFGGNVNLEDGFLLDLEVKIVLVLMLF